MGKITEETRHKLVGTNGATMYIEKSKEGFILTSGESTKVCVDIDQDTATELANLFLKPLRKPTVTAYNPRNFKAGDRVIVKYGVTGTGPDEIGIVKSMDKDREYAYVLLKSDRMICSANVSIDRLTHALSPTVYPGVGDTVVVALPFSSHLTSKTGLVKDVTKAGLSVELTGWGSTLVFQQHELIVVEKS